MVFWRKKKNAAQYEQEERDEKILHPEGEPGIEPSTDYEAEMDEDTRHEIEDEKGSEILDDLRLAPTPSHDRLNDAEEAEEFADDSQEGGWLSRLTRGLSKSTNKITKGLGDLVTKKPLDQDTLDALEEVLIAADLGPKTAARIIGEFSKDRFGKEISEEEIREALAETIAQISGLSPSRLQSPDPPTARSRCWSAASMASVKQQPLVRSLRICTTSKATKLSWPQGTPSAPPRSNNSKSGRGALTARSCRKISVLMRHRWLSKPMSRPRAQAPMC